MRSNRDQSFGFLALKDVDLAPTPFAPDPQRRAAPIDHPDTVSLDPDPDDLFHEPSPHFAPRLTPKAARAGDPLCIFGLPENVLNLLPHFGLKFAGGA